MKLNSRQEFHMILHHVETIRKHLIRKIRLDLTGASINKIRGLLARYPLIF